MAAEGNQEQASIVLTKIVLSDKHALAQLLLEPVLPCEAGDYATTATVRRP